MSSQSILVRNIDSIHDSSEKTLLKNANNFVLSKRFAIERKVDSRRLAHAIKLLSFVCTENCELINSINRILIEGTEENSSCCVSNHSIKNSSYPMNNTSYLNSCLPSEARKDPFILNYIANKVICDLGLNRNFLGWVLFEDDMFTETSPLTIDADVRTQLTNNAATVTNITFPVNGTTWWNSINNRFAPDNIGDTFTIRVQFKVKSTLNNQEITLELDNGSTDPIEFRKTIKLDIGAGEETPVVENINISTLSQIVSNGAAFYITSDACIEIYDISFKIDKEFRNNP